VSTILCFDIILDDKLENGETIEGETNMLYHGPGSYNKHSINQDFTDTSDNGKGKTYRSKIKV